MNYWRFRNVFYGVARKPEQPLPLGSSPPECHEDPTGDPEEGGQQNERQKG